MTIHTAILPLATESRPDQTPVGLEETARNQPGVLDVTLDPLTQLLRVVFDDEMTELNEITHFLAQYGFPTKAPVSVREGRQQ